MRVPKPAKSTLGRMMEEEELMSKAAGCPPGHTYNPIIKKCLPGSPLSGIGSGGGGKPSGNGGNSGGSADAAISAEVAMRQSQGLSG